MPDFDATNAAIAELLPAIEAKQSDKPPFRSYPVGWFHHPDLSTVSVDRITTRGGQGYRMVFESSVEGKQYRRIIGRHTAEAQTRDWFEVDPPPALTLEEAQEQAEANFMRFLLAWRDQFDAVFFTTGAYPTADWSHSEANIPTDGTRRRPDQLDTWPDLRLLAQLPPTWHSAISIDSIAGGWRIKAAIIYDGQRYERSFSNVAVGVQEWQ